MTDYETTAKEILYLLDRDIMCANNLAYLATSLEMEHAIGKKEGITEGYKAMKEGFANAKALSL